MIDYDTMKTLKLLLLFMTCTTLSFGQKLEFAGQLNSGLAKYGGESAARATAILHNITSEGTYSYTNHPYGSRFAPSPSFGASVQLQRVTRRNLLLGVQAGAESLRSSIQVQGVYVTESSWNSVSSEYKSANGKTVIRNDFLNLHPYLGYRINTGAVDVDLSIGPEIGVGLKSREKGEATAEDGSEYTTNREINDPEADIRGRVGVILYHNHFGLSVSYAHGVTNYMRGYDGGNSVLYSRVLRLGLLYRL